jgi:thioredoxin 1
MKVKELTKTTYSKAISEGIILIDFWAKWCGPCRQIAPIIEEIAEHYANDEKITIAKVDTDENQDLAISNNIRSIPSILIFKNGELQASFVGVKSKEFLINEIEKLK